MINLYKQQDQRNKNKTMFPINKSHIASMNLKINTQASFPQTNYQQHLKNHTIRIQQDQQKSRSGHKYKKSLILQDNTIHLIKKNSENYPKSKDMGMSTERLSKQKLQKRSVEHAATRIKTEMDEVKNENKSKNEANMIEVDINQLRQMVVKLKRLKSEKQNLKRQLHIFKKQFKKHPPQNSVLKALSFL